MAALQHANWPVVNALLNRVDIGDTINAFDDEGKCTLAFAMDHSPAKSNDVAMKIIDRGDMSVEVLNSLDDRNRNLWAIGVQHEQVAACVRLLKRQDITANCLNAYGPLGHTALLWACEKKQPEIALALLARKDLTKESIAREARDYEGAKGKTALYWAKEHG